MLTAICRTRMRVPFGGEEHIVIKVKRSASGEAGKARFQPIVPDLSSDGSVIIFPYLSEA